MERKFRRTLIAIALTAMISSVSNVRAEDVATSEGNQAAATNNRELNKDVSKADHDSNETDEDQVEFDSAFFSGSGVDVSRYSRGNPVPAGMYFVKVSVNEKLVGHSEIKFIDNPKDPLRALPCLDSKFFDVTGIKIDEMDDEQCRPLNDWLPDARWKLDVNEQVFQLTVPQALIIERRADEVPVALWDDGINAAFMGYNLNYYRSHSSGETTDTAYAGIDGGLNLFGWRARIRGNANYDSTSDDTSFDSSNLYVEHDVTALKSQFRAGEIYGSSSFFDSFPMKGVSLSSDTRMLPDSLNNFKPVIRGVAETNAKVVVKQKGNTILETTVPPGAFNIQDYNPISSSDDLDITINEADGRTRSFSIPYNSGSRLLYPGVGLYTLNVGRYDQSDNDDPLIAQATYQYGLNNLITLYSGVEYLTDYYAAQGGVSFNTSIGAISLDVTHSSLDTDEGDTLSGQSWGLTYSGKVNSTDTNIDLSAYRYSTENYYDLDDAIYYLSDDNDNRVDNMRSKIQVNINQTFADGWGSIYTSGTWTDYWDSDRTEKSYQLGYNNNIGRISYSISVNRYYNEDNEKDDQIYLSLSIPLGGESKDNLFDYMNVNYTSNNNGKNRGLSTNSSGYSKEKDLYYGVNAGYNKNDGYGDDRLANAGGNLSWNSRFGTLGGSVSASTDDSRQLSLSADGGVIVHRGGVTFGRDINNDSAIALVEAKGAKGARVTNDNAVSVNNAGYAFVSNLSPYHYNDVALDPSTMEKDTELKETSVRVVPRAGAIIEVPFRTDDRRSVFLMMRKADGSNVPFGAEVFNEQRESVGMLGQNGRAFTRGLADSGHLTVEWGNKPEEQCAVDFKLPVVAHDDIQQMTLLVDHLICR
ncbi:fimbria/pilus outer membrane usher protein [Scandinavium manionii]|uniref:fimbria/pilus outer membrane usher protein n=1 Tax=Scandinavium manionii TaxID=2926520 RepID=UPI00216502A0|nr:fimbria/pilus outer membrane usher protein [Scandinavium manionii]MCS2149607.1 fimbria/pilus outer membrane usher protein [Scandinavium manionii]